MSSKNTTQNTSQAEVLLYASKKTWIEGEALNQLNRAAAMPGMTLVVGLPDLHAGKGTPIGAALVCQDRIYPGVVGGDIGCGMGLWRAGIRTRKCKRDRWAKKLRDLELPWEGDRRAWLEQSTLSSTSWDDSMGTLGGGNHFAELQQVDQVLVKDQLEKLGMLKDELLLLVHSGSRGLGQAVLTRNRSRFGVGGQLVVGEGAQSYLRDHDHAVAWARANRELIAHRFLDQIGGSPEPVLDLCHNSVMPIASSEGRRWLHRKGAAPSDEGVAVIPGSRGSLSYLVMPVGDQSRNANSIAHGAGRKWPRGECRKRLSARYTHESLLQTSLGSKVICADRELVYAEAPQVYKDVDQVVKDLVEAGLIEVIATLKPIITYKTRKR